MLVAAMSMGVLSACGNSGDTQPKEQEPIEEQKNEEGETDEEGQETPDGQEASQTDKTFKIGYACMDMSNTYHATVAKYFQEECDRRGIDLIILDDEKDGTKAVENCQTICDAGCDVYLSTLGFLVGDTMKEICDKSGVLAIGLDEAIPGAPFFGANGLEAGVVLGDGLADAAKEKWGEDVKIDLYIGLENLAVGDNGLERMQTGVLGTLRTKLDIPDDIYVQCDAGTDSQAAMRWTEDTINAHPEAEHIIIAGCVDDNAMGAEAVVEKLGYQDKVVIGSVDGSVLAINNFKNPDTVWVCSAAMTPELYAYYLLEELEPYLKGEQQSLPDTWYVPPFLITKDNYKEKLEEQIFYDDYTVE